MRSGTKSLRIASLIQIALGVVGILLVRVLLKDGDFSGISLTAGAAMGSLIAAYAGYGFQIFAGIAGLVLSNKKSKVTVIIGLLLFIPSIFALMRTNGNIALIIINVILLVFPFYYLMSAVKNYRD